MRATLLPLLLLSFTPAVLAQGAPAAGDPGQVCVYVDNVPGMNPWMTDAHRDRMRAKLVTVASKSGVVHVGLSSFLLYPQVDIVDVTVADGGMKPITVAKMEVILSLARLDRLDAPLSKPGTIFNSMTLSLIGTGSDTSTAVNDAIGKIQPSNPDIARFLKDSRARIMEFYQAHCTEVINEAIRAYELQNYAMSIALLYSVPEGTTCYEDAREYSVRSYREYQKTECQKKLIQLKSTAVIMKGPDADAASKQRQYGEVLKLVKSMDPTAEGCYEEAYNMLNNLAADFDGENKRNFDMVSKVIDNEADVQKEMYKAMGQVNSQMQPGGTTVVVVK
jgi:hypothetical protein